MRSTYLQFVSSLALLGAATSFAGCSSSTGADGGDVQAFDSISTGQPCTLEGQACDPSDAGSVNCCRCVSTADASGDADDAGPVTTGRWQGYCIGPLNPPDVATA